MKKNRCLLVLPLVMLLSCDTGVPPSSSSGRKIERADFSRITIRLVDYNKVEVSHQLGSDLYSNELVAVSIGIKDTSSYVELARSSSIFDTKAGVYRLSFSLIAKMDSSKLNVPLTTRYLLSDSSSIDIDTSVVLYTYPYASSQVLVTYLIGAHGYFQDFDRIGNKLFFHPTGPEGLFEYDLSTAQLRQLFLYIGGDHMAADSNFVFCESGVFLYRYNLISDSVDLRAQVLPSRTSGIDTHNGYLYVVAGYPPVSIRRYSYDGVFLDSTTFSIPEGVYYFTIDNNTAYMTVISEPTRLMRYNLQTNTLLTDVMGPGYDLLGIKVYQGMLYFSDLNKFFIGYVPISDLKN